ncbi:MAG: apolipoprotein N-acyltransferase [Bacteroidetes bacterium]|nr:apolipoprotein N-acyltransferase [Bacteroidota bacterium]
MRGKLFLLSFLSAGLFAAAWPPYGFTPLLFVAFIPLLYVQHIISGDNRLRAKHLFLYAYITFLVWNLLTIWWIWYASEGGSIMAIATNSVLMALLFLLFHKLKRALPERVGTFALIPLWISFEFIHHHWDLSWPWLTLGNGLAKEYTFIQWYEYTGIFGGSFWILIVNVLIFEILIHRNTLLRPVFVKLYYIISVCGIIILPIIFSLFQYYHFDTKANTLKPINVVVVQPNVDPYQKFTLDFKVMTEKMLALAETKIDSNTDYIVFPETSLVESIWENDIQYTWTVNRLRTFLKKYPKLKIVSGANTAHEYAANEKHSPTTRKFNEQNIYFDSYNTAIQIDCTKTIPIYHKSQLVPGVERMPFRNQLGFLEKFALDLGGTSGSLGMQEERTVFYSKNGPGKVAPVICYESVFGDYVGQYIRNGADYIFIMTNDGWWRDTPGYKQHLLYGRLRAIETRKSIARSANTGISCFINQRGDIEQQQKWWTESAIKETLYSTEGMTFYTKHGDYIAKAMVWLSIGGMIFAIGNYFRKRFSRKTI